MTAEPWQDNLLNWSARMSQQKAQKVQYGRSDEAQDCIAVWSYTYTMRNLSMSTTTCSSRIFCYHTTIITGCLQIWQNKIPEFWRFSRAYKLYFPDNYKLEARYYKSAWKWNFITLIYKTRMWANAQHDSQPAEHRWRPLLNAAKFG